MNGAGIATLLLIALATPADPDSAVVQTIAAEDRDQWQAWVDERIGALQKALTTPGGSDERAAIVAEMDQAQVDWQSFLARAPKNYDFPKMLLYNEYYRWPLYCLNPVRCWHRRMNGPPAATNVDPTVGDIRHSTFYTHTSIESYTPERIVAEFESFQPKGCLKITKVKKGGTSEGIWAEDEGGRTFIIIFDPPFAPEMTTSAEYIGSTLTRIAGWNVPKTCIYTVQGTGDCAYDGRRAVATIALKNFKGGWRAEPFRCRREIRALQTFAAWINNVDQTEQNTGVTIDKNGVCRHYVLDFGASLGSFTFRPQPSRLGWTKLFDAYHQLMQPLYNCGVCKVPWEAPYAAVSPAVGYFNDNFDPDTWQPFYQHMGFVEITAADRRWAADRIARFTDDQLRIIVDLAAYSNPCDRDHVLQTLIRRRDVIVEHYLNDEISWVGSSASSQSANSVSD